MMSSALPDLSHLVSPGQTIPVRVIPKAKRAAVAIVDGNIRIHVTVAPEGGKANKEALRLLAAALGVAKSRLTLLRGAASRDKFFRLG